MKNRLLQAVFLWIKTKRLTIYYLGFNNKFIPGFDMFYPN